MTVEQLAKRLGAELACGSGVRGLGSGVRGQIKAVGPVETAGGDEVTFVTRGSGVRGRGSGVWGLGRAALLRSRAGAVIVGERIEGLAMPQLIVRNVDAALIEALGIFAPRLKRQEEGIDPSAKVGQDVKIAQGVSIEAGAVISDKAEIGQGSVIGSGCKIGENSSIGANCRLDGNVVVYHNCRIGNNVIIQANSTIGSTGFGYCCIEGEHKLIPHNGGVVIEDFVEIGANCCVDRAKFGNTVIGAGTKIDNLVQIAHNVIIGRCCLIAGQVGIAGSCKIGDGVVLGGQAGVTDNIKIGDGAMIGGQSGVFQDVPPKGRLFGTPATGIAEASKIISLTKRLPKLAETVKQLRKRIEKLESAFAKASADRQKTE